MKMKRLSVPKEYEYKKTEWEVLYMMKGHYVWHRENYCTDFEIACKVAQRLEKECECFTEIRKTEKIIHVYKYWDDYSED